MGHPWILSCRKETGPSLSEVAATLRSHQTQRKPIARTPSIRGTLSPSNEETLKLKISMEGKNFFYLEKSEVFQGCKDSWKLLRLRI
jgi:hypothetical protein